MRDEYEGPSTQAQSTWFPALMAALFVMLALGAIATMYSAVKGTRPQLAAAGTMGLWLLVSVLMFCGAGMFPTSFRSMWQGCAVLICMLLDSVGANACLLLLLK